MAKKIRKVYLPKWISWFTLAMIAPIWGWLTYMALYPPPGKEDELGFAGWLVLTIVLLGSVVMVFLMSHKRLPAYIVEEEEQ